MSGKIKFFKQTSDEPYDRHQYKLELEDGKSVIMDSYEEIKGIWYQYIDEMKGATVSVLDRKQKSSKGFG